MEGIGQQGDPRGQCLVADICPPGLRVSPSLGCRFQGRKQGSGEPCQRCPLHPLSCPGSLFILPRPSLCSVLWALPRPFFFWFCPLFQGPGPLSALTPMPITGVLYAPLTSPGSFQGLLLLEPRQHPPLHSSSASGWKPSGQSLPYPQGGRSFWSCC